MDNPIQRRFHADPRVRAVEPLLHERIPILSSAAPHLHAQRECLRPMSVGEVAPSVSKFDTPHTAHAQDASCSAMAAMA